MSSGRFSTRAWRELRRYPVPYGLGAAILVGAVAFIVLAGSSKAGAHSGKAMTAEAAQIEAGMVKGCETYASHPICECQAQRLVERDGIDTNEEAVAFLERLQTINRTHNFDDAPPELRDAVLTCLKTA